MQLLLHDVNTYKDNLHESAFTDFLEKLMKFLLCMICDTQYLILMDADPMSVPQHYELEFLGEKLTSTEGLFATIATITNFLCKFHSRIANFICSAIGIRFCTYAYMHAK